MTNTRENLIELICSTEYGNSSLIGNNFQKGFIEKIADHIISSGFIEELQIEAYDLGVDSALHNHFGLSWEDAAGLRKEVTRLQNATKWIPVTERLPQEDLPFEALCEVVQVLLNDGSVTIGWCNRGLRLWFHMPIRETKIVGYEYEKTPVIAWQPLSQPPSGAKNE